MKIENDRPYLQELPKQNPTSAFSLEEAPTASVENDRRVSEYTRQACMDTFKPVERIIIQRIFSVDGVDPRYLERLREMHDGNQMVFVEYYCQLSKTSYVFFDKNCHQGLPPDRRRPGVQPNGTTVLLRVKKSGIPTVVHSWSDDEE